MVRLVGVVLLLLPALPAAAAEDKPKDKPDTPAGQYQALLQDYQKDLKDAKTPQEKMQLGPKYGPKFLELAEKNPKDTTAVDALVWVAQNVQARGKDNVQAKALEALARDHAASDKVGPACEGAGRSLDKAAGDFLHAALDKNPSREVQGEACMALAQYVKTRNQILEVLKQQPALAARLEQLVGKEYTDELKKMDPAEGEKEAKELFERAVAKYGDVKLAGGGTVAEKVKPQLERVKNLGKLVAGKPAPEIEGEDLEGKKFKLSDYRGKVVLLDFWGNW
jgi:hypothetical protein